MIETPFRVGDVVRVAKNPLYALTKCNSVGVVVANFLSRKQASVAFATLTGDDRRQAKELLELSSENTTFDIDHRYLRRAEVSKLSKSTRTKLVKLKIKLAAETASAY
jgi:NMD protein affecting ribosome stability and mRNA decay